MDVGAYLRSARERRGLTLEQVARSTKLSTAVLQLIERNAWNRLPGGLITRGHLRAYAAEVRVNPEDVVNEYLAQLPPPAVPQAPAPRTSAAHSAQPALLALAVVSIIAAVATYDWLAKLPIAPVVPAGDGVQLRPAQESPALSEAVNAPPTTPQPLHLALAIDVTGPCWVSVRADQQLVVYRLLEAGEAVDVAANEQLVLRVGDAGTFSYTLNGLPGRPIGDRGQPVTVTITRDNVETFTAASTPVRAKPREAARNIATRNTGNEAGAR